MTMVKLRCDFHVGGHYSEVKEEEADGSTWYWLHWSPGFTVPKGTEFRVHGEHRQASGIPGLQDGIVARTCFREIKPATDTMVAESEMLLVPAYFLVEVEDDKS